MTQEEKDLLLKDLCARLPYGVKFNYGGYNGFDYTLEIMTSTSINDDFPIGDCKPYLRPMSSMTEDEKKRYDDILTKMYYHEKSTLGDISDYLNSIHVDYRGLISKGLAIAVNETNNPYKG